jgi:hypothetical protein
VLRGITAAWLLALVALTGPAVVCAQALDTPVALPASLAAIHALTFLKSLPREWSGTSARDCKTYEDKNIERLSPSFAFAAARFLRAFVEVHGHVTITSAHRTAEEQVCVCDGEKGPCAGRPRMVKTQKHRRIVRRSTSRHQKGIALDVRAGTGTDDEFVCLNEFARLNPEFGVHFPLGQRDRPHMELATPRGGLLRVAALGVVRHQVIPCARLKTMLVNTPID